MDNKEMVVFQSFFKRTPIAIDMDSIESMWIKELDREKSWYPVIIELKNGDKGMEYYIYMGSNVDEVIDNFESFLRSYPGFECNFVDNY